MGKRTRIFRLSISILVLLAVLVLWQCNYYWGFPLTEDARQLRRARAVYEGSRQGNAPINSRKFLAFGIRRGMSEKEVESRLPPASLIARGLRIESGMVWKGKVNSYEFDHDPTPPADRAGPLYSSETLMVFFDEHGRARRIILRQFGRVHDFPFASHTHEFELEE